jgi:hypothetical protein
MQCRTLATVSSLVVLFVGLFVTGHAQANLIDNSTVTILGTSTPAFPGYPQADAIDQGANMYVTDYASQSAGVGTHLDFAFTQPEFINQIVYTDRTTSGGSNGGFVGGTGDYTTQYEYIFATDPGFTDIVGTVVEGPRPTPTGTLTVASFQEIDDFAGITAQYVEWKVLAANGANVGAADFEFSAVPEPSSVVALFGLGAMGLFVAARRRMRKVA